MTDDVSAKLEELHAEIKALRHEQAVTRRIVSTAAMRHHWARHLVSDLETNPRTQYKVHLYGVIYWLINFPAIVYLFFGQPNLLDQARHLHHLGLFDLRELRDGLRGHVSGHGGLRR